MTFVQWLSAGVFATAALACFLSLGRLSDVTDGDTQRGLTGLLVLSGLWATFEVGRILVPGLAAKTAFYVLGLVVGLATVGAWLYFCSAYTGHDYHRRSTVRLVALGGYLLVVAVKLTNPLHGLYYDARLEAEPFSHLVIRELPLEVTVAVLAYALTAVGFFLLYQLLTESQYNTRGLGILVGLMALPVGFNLLTQVSSVLVLDLNYEPVGVALFAVGALFFVEEKFVAVATFGRPQVVEALDEPVVLLDRNGVIRDVNEAARSTCGLEATAVGSALTDVDAPMLEPGGDGSGLLTVERDGTTHHFLPTETPLTVGTSQIGRALVFTDVTTLEQQRRELRRQNEQLDGFATALTHELMNTLSVVSGHVGLASMKLSADAEASVGESLDVAKQTTKRMAHVVEDLSAVVRYGQTVDALDPCSLSATAQHAWDRTTTDEMRFSVTGDDRQFLADRDRLVMLLIEAFEFAHRTESSSVTLAQDGTRFSVTTDGETLSSEQGSRAFEYGTSVPNAEAGMTLPNVRTLAAVHGWRVDIDTEYTDGVRLRIDGIELADDAEGTHGTDESDSSRD